MLDAAGLSASVVSRRAQKLPEGFTAINLDLTQARQWIVPENAIVISLLPLWVLSRHINRLMGAQSLIAVSSTSRFSKSASDDPKERAIADQLTMAENIITAWAPRSHVAYTILRPTLIYDGHSDQNITKIASFIQRFGCFPVASPAKGLRQPIHAEDVAKAIMASLGNASTYYMALNIAGGEILTYRTMVERIFAALGKSPRIIPMPVALLEQPFKLLTKLGIIKETSFGFGAFRRMNEDLIFDSSEGSQLLNYAPRPFEPELNFKN